MIKHILLALGIILSLNTPVLAAPSTLSEEQIDKIQTHFKMMFEKLDLTSEQQEKFVPVMRKSMKERFVILKSYGFSANQRPKLSFKQKLSLRDEINKSQEASNKEFASFLSPTQMTKLEEIQKETRAKMRDRILNGKK